MSDVEISVIIPVYNCRKYLLKCVQYLVGKRGYQGLEVVLIDDGSTDGSGDLCDDIAAQNSEYIIHVIHTKHPRLTDVTINEKYTR